MTLQITRQKDVVAVELARRNDDVGRMSPAYVMHGTIKKHDEVGCEKRCRKIRLTGKK